MRTLRMVEVTLQFLLIEDKDLFMKQSTGTMFMVPDDLVTGDIRSQAINRYWPITHRTFQFQHQKG